MTNCGVVSRLPATALRMGSSRFVEIIACGKCERESDRVRLSRRVANTNEAQIERRRATQRRGQFFF